MPAIEVPLQLAQPQRRGEHVRTAVGRCAVVVGSILLVVLEAAATGAVQTESFPPFFNFTAAHLYAGYGSLAAVNTTADPAHVRNLFFDNLEIISIFIGLSLLIISLGLSRKHASSLRCYPWPGVVTFIAGASCLACGTPAVLRLLSPSRQSFAVPTEAGMGGTVCSSCVVFFSTVIVFPLLFNAISVFSNFFFQYCISAAKGYYNGDGMPVGERLDDSFQHPNTIFIVLVAVMHLVMFCCLIARCMKIGGWTGMHAFSMLWINSGATAFMLLGMFAFLLSERTCVRNPYVDGGFLRFLNTLILFVVSLPTVVVYALPAMFRWWWFMLPVEAFLTLVMFVCLDNSHKSLDRYNWWFVAKDVYVDIRQWQSGRVILRMLLDIFLSFMFLPLVPLGKYIVEKLQIRNAVELIPGLRTLAVSVVVLIKTIAMQFYVGASALSYAGVDYSTVIPLLMYSRHWHCNFCLLFASVTKGTRLVRSTWQSFISFLL